MRVLGLEIIKGQLRYSVLEGTKEEPSLIGKNRIVVPEMESIPELMDWFDSEFDELISKYKPSKIAYRLALEPRKQQMSYLIYPWAILNLKCFEKDLEAKDYIKRNFVPNKFGLGKNIDLYNHCDEIFGINPPYWDKNQKYSLLAAWLELD